MGIDNIAQSRLKSNLSLTSSYPGALIKNDVPCSIPIGQTGYNPMVYEEDEEDDSEEEGSEDPPIQRDDLRNPYWIEDKDVLNGPRGHLKMDEIEFWKGISFLKYFKLKYFVNHNGYQ